MPSDSAQVLEITKKCNKCGIEKVLSDFWKYIRNSDGRETICRQCKSSRRKLKLKRRKFSPIKTCTKCRVEKPLSSFPRHATSTIDGHLNQCDVCVKEYKNKYSKKWRKDHKGYQRFHSRKWILRTKYNLSIEAYTALFKKQNGKCAICLNDMEIMGHHTHVDHCHTTGVVRGILCRHCNRGLGAFKDNETSLRNAINYLLLSRMV